MKIGRQGHIDHLFDWLLFQCCCKSLEQDVLGCRPECGATARSEPGSCTTTQKSWSLFFLFTSLEPCSQKSVEVCESVSFSLDSRFSIIKNDIYFMSWCTFHVWWRLWKYNVKWSCFINAPFKISLEERGMRSEAKRDIIDTAIETSFPHFFQHTIIRWSGSVFFLFLHTTDLIVF